MRLALRLDPDPAVQEDAQAGAGMGVPVGDAAGREVDAVAAEQPGRRPAARSAPRRARARRRGRARVCLVARDVVDDAVAGLGLDAVRVLRQAEDQWKYWPPSITIVWPVTKSEPGPQR